MLDKRKVKLMTRLALYEQNQGKEDFRISEYYRKDYVGIHMWFTFFWVTAGYILLIGLLMLLGMDVISNRISAAFMVILVGMIVIGYIFCVGIYLVLTSHMYNKKHKQARQRVKVYNHNLLRLLKLYEKEKK